MPFNFHLKNALEKKGGVISHNGNSVSFFKDDMVLTFFGSDESEMVEDINGIKHEQVRIKFNDTVLNLDKWLHKDSPFLMTGKNVVKNKNGNIKSCHEICYKIMRDLGFSQNQE